MVEILMNGGASQLSRRVAAVNSEYKAWIMAMADAMMHGKWNQSLMLDAVLLASEINDEREIKKLLSDPIHSPTDTLLGGWTFENR